MIPKINMAGMVTMGDCHPRPILHRRAFQLEWVSRRSTLGTLGSTDCSGGTVVKLLTVHASVRYGTVQHSLKVKSKSGEVEDMP